MNFLFLSRVVIKKGSYTRLQNSSLARTALCIVFAMGTDLPVRAFPCVHLFGYLAVKLARSCTVITKRMNMDARAK